MSYSLPWIGSLPNENRIQEDCRLARASLDCAVDGKNWHIGLLIDPALSDEQVFKHLGAIAEALDSLGAYGAKRTPATASPA